MTSARSWNRKPQSLFPDRNSDLTMERMKYFQERSRCQLRSGITPVEHKTKMSRTNMGKKSNITLPMSASPLIQQSPAPRLHLLGDGGRVKRE